MIEITALTKTYGAFAAVTDLSFQVKSGEVLGLVGESGSGKSMTGYSIMGLVDAPGKVVAGTMLFDGGDLSGHVRPGSDLSRQPGWLCRQNQ